MTTNTSFKTPWRIAAYTVAAMLATFSLPSTAAAATPLVSQASGSCLDLPGFDTSLGAPIDIWSCDGGGNQQWEFTAAGEVRTLDGSRCLDASGGGTVNGTKVISYTCNGGTNQKWSLNGNGQLIGQASGLCLDVVGGATANGTPVVLWGCNGGSNQKWTKGSTGGGGSADYPIYPGFIGVDLKNNTKGAWRDDQVYVAVIGRNPANGQFSYLKPDGSLTQLNVGDNDRAGHLSKGGQNYSNYFFTLAQSKLLKLPKMDSGRVFMSVGSPMFIKVLIDGANNVGFAGPNPLNTSDANIDVYYDWYEFTYNNAGLWINTTQVDQFGMPLLLDVWGENRGFHKQVGINDSRASIYQKFASEVPGEFRGISTPHRIMAPAKMSFGEGQANSRYFDGYVNQVWDYYRNNTMSIDMWGGSRRFDGRVQGDQLVFTEVNKNNGAYVGGTYRIAGKPTTQDVLEGRGRLASGNWVELALEAQVCAALNRHIATDVGQWRNPGAWYKAGPANYYAKFWHDHGVGGIAYGFAYDDVSEQSSTIYTPTPEHMAFSVGW